MRSLSQIKGALTKIKEDNGLSGVSVDLAIDLLSQYLYYRNVDTVSILNSNNIDTTTSINTLIKYALDNLYPLYRGRGAVVKFPMVYTSPEVSLRKGTKVFSSKTYNLYLLEDVAFNVQDNQLLTKTDDLSDSEISNYIVWVTCVASTNFYDKVELSNQRAFYAESDNIANATEDVYLYSSTNNGVSYNDIPYTRYAPNHINPLQSIYDFLGDMYENALNSTLVSDIKRSYEENGPSFRISPNNLGTVTQKPLPLLLTSYNYGLRVYPSEIGVEQSSNGETYYMKLAKLNGNTKYYASYYQYSDVTPTINELRTFNIAGMQLCELPNYRNPNTGQYDIVTKIVPPIPRENANDGVAYKIKVNLVSMQQVRANFDLQNTFNTWFYDKVYNSTYEITDDNRISLRYIPRSNGNLITSAEFAEFRNRFVYYITEDFVLDAGVPRVAEKVTSSIAINIYASYQIDRTLITNIVQSYNFSTPGIKDEVLVITAEELYGEINKIDGVDHCSIDLRYISGDTGTGSIQDRKEQIQKKFKEYYPNDNRTVLAILEKGQYLDFAISSISEELNENYRTR